MSPLRPKRLLPDIKQQWLDALRSGEYTQGTGYLHYAKEEVDKFCCLGVLCDLAAKAGVTIPGQADVEDEDAQDALFAYQGAQTMPPATVTYWAFGVDRVEYGPYPGDLWWEVPTPNGVDTNARELNLASLNDDHGFSFNGIADVIEREL